MLLPFKADVLPFMVPSPECHEIYAQNNHHLRVFQASLYQNTSDKIYFFLYLYIIIYIFQILTNINIGNIEIFGGAEGETKS